MSARIWMVVDAIFGTVRLFRLSSPAMGKGALLVELSSQVLLAELGTRLHDLLRTAGFNRL